MLSPIDSCVRRTPDSYPPYNPAPIPPVKKTTTDELNEAIDHLIEGSAKIGSGDPDKQYSNPFDPNAPKINYAPVSFGGKGGASVSGPSVLGSYIKLGFNFIIEVVPILIRSETVQTAVQVVGDTVKEAAKTVSNAIQTAAKEVGKAVTNAVSTVANWFSSWF